MAAGISQATKDTAMDDVITGTVYVQLHVGDPGSAGTANVAANSTRQGVTFAASSSGNKLSNSQASWMSVSTTETYSYASLWSAATGGTFYWSGSVSNGAVTAGDTFQIASGAITLSISGAA